MGPVIKKEKTIDIAAQYNGEFHNWKRKIGQYRKIIISILKFEIYLSRLHNGELKNGTNGYLATQSLCICSSENLRSIALPSFRKWYIFLLMLSMPLMTLLDSEL